MSNHLLIVRASVPWFNEFLKLPKEIKVIRIRQTWEQELSGGFEVLLEGDPLPEVPEGGAIPEGSIITHSEYCPACEKHHVVRSEIGNR